MLIRLSSPRRGRCVFNELRMTLRPSPAAPKLHNSTRDRPARTPRVGGQSGRNGMLETIAIILIVLWLLGVVSGYTMGNFIYVLLVVAIILFLVRLVGGRRVV
jgi:hypothetical protein